MSGGSCPHKCVESSVRLCVWDQSGPACVLGLGADLEGWLSVAPQTMGAL